MPPLPTSLSVVALVVAWLVVLVPMAARRREKVPDSDERSAGFRVLRRSARRRQRRVLSRTAVVAGDTDADELNAEVDPMDEQTLWSDEDDFADDVESDDRAGRSPGGRTGRRGVRADAMSGEVADEEIDEIDDLDEEFADEDEDSDLAESLFDEDGEDANDDTEVDGLDDRAGGYAELPADERDRPLADTAVPAADPRSTRHPAAAGARGAWRAAPEAAEAGRWAADYAGQAEYADQADQQDGEYSDAADEWAAEHPAARASRGMPRAEGSFDGDPSGRSGRVLVSRGAGEQRSDSGMSGDPGRTASTRGYPEETYQEHAEPAYAGTAYIDPTDAGTAYDEAPYAEPADMAPTNAGPADVDPAALRPVPRRPGRGGFDPEAAAKAKAYRYRRRRRVTLVLLFATVVFTLVSVFLIRTAWVGAAVCGVLLVGYLAYLRRQVRIEEAIRQRRMARLAQARQVRPDYGREYGRDGLARPPRDWDGDASLGSRVDDYRDDPRAAGYPAADHPSVPPARYRSGTVVDLDDDDPAFSDLEYHQPLTYRRASGQ